jgi:hypothetical protein
MMPGLDVFLQFAITLAVGMFAGYLIWGRPGA